MIVAGALKLSCVFFLFVSGLSFQALAQRQDNRGNNNINIQGGNTIINPQAKRVIKIRVMRTGRMLVGSGRTWLDALTSAVEKQAPRDCDHPPEHPGSKVAGTRPWSLYCEIIEEVCPP